MLILGLSLILMDVYEINILMERLDCSIHTIWSAEMLIYSSLFQLRACLDKLLS